jgi:sulfate adenylyltransferase
MNKINLNKNQFSDLLNLLNNVFFPLKNFVNKADFLQIIDKKKIKNTFFPLPIFFGINKKIYHKIKDKKKLDLFYNNKYLINIYKINFYDLNKDKICNNIYGSNFLKHPYYKKFVDENYKFLCFKFKNPNHKNLNHKYFLSPQKFKIKFKINKLSNLASFHTRNVPHNAHQWIHNYLYKKFNALLIQPLIGQYKEGEYSDDLIIKTNKLAASFFNTTKVFSIPFFSYPRYAGFREAALHSIVRKNYGCTHFWVGRDHAGYKDFYGHKQSQKFCFKNQSKLKIKIVAGNEPYYCANCKKIKNTKCLSKKCLDKHVKKISGSKIRELLRKNKPISEYLMNPKISKLLSKKFLLS